MGATVALSSTYTAYWWWRYVRADDPSVLLLAIIGKHTRGMRVEPADIDRFVTDHAPGMMGFIKSRAAWAGTVSPAYVWFDVFSLSEDIGTQFRLVEDRVMTNFLMSTDFFLNGADLGKPVRYLALYDPLKHPCRGLALT